MGGHGATLSRNLFDTFESTAASAQEVTHHFSLHQKLECDTFEPTAGNSGSAFEFALLTCAEITPA